MSNTKHTIQQVENSTDLLINIPITNAQTMVKLCHNGQSWLSPTGWSQDVKNTLLDSRAEQAGSQVSIPAHFCAHIQDGDSLSLTIAAIDFEGSILWKTPTPSQQADATAKIQQDNQDSHTPDAITKPVPKSKSGFKARLSTQKPNQASSDIERLAREAKIAADKSAEDMRIAQQAKEAAEQRAIEAARLAEAAHKMELERIEQAKQAKAALRAAEATQRAEEERLEIERQAEAARQLEAARLVEIDRLKNEAEKLEASKIVEINRLKTKHKSLEGQFAKIQGTLVSFGKAVTDSLANSKQIADETQHISETLTKAQQAQHKTKSKLTHKQSKFNTIIAASTQAKSGYNEANKQTKTLTTAAQKALQVHQDAQQALKAAIAHAETAKVQSEKAQATLSAHQSKLQDASTHNAAMASQKTEHEAALRQAKAQMEEQSNTVESLKSKLANLRADASRYDQDTVRIKKDLETAQFEMAKTESLKTGLANHIQALKSVEISPDTIIELEKDGVDIQGAPATLFAHLTGHTLASASVDICEEEPTGLKAKLFKKRKTQTVKITSIQPFIEPRATEPSKPLALAVDNPKITNTKPQINADENPFPTKKTAYGALAFLAAAGAVTLVANQDSTPKSLIDTQKPLISAQSETLRVEPSSVLTATETMTPKTVRPQDSTLNALGQLDENTPETPDIPAQRFSELGTGLSFTNHLQNLAAEIPARTPKPKSDTLSKNVPNRIAAKSTRIPDVEPQIGARPVVTAQPKPDPIINAVRRPPISANSAPKLQASIPATPIKARAAQYADMHVSVQNKLSDLGFYQGPSSGQLDASTIAAMNDFQTLFGLAKTNTVTPELLTELGRAGIRIPDPVDVKVETERLAPIPQYTVETPVLNTEPKPDLALKPDAESGFQDEDDSTQDPLEISHLKILPAAIPAIPQSEPESTKAVEDIIIAAKKIKGRAPLFPALSLDSAIGDTIVIVGYSIGVDGKVFDITTKNIEGGGSARKAFERAAERSIKSFRFQPKTINGEPVLSLDHSTRVVFNLE